MLRLAILASTNGTNIDRIVEEINNKRLDATIQVMVSNKECGAIEKAKRFNIQHAIVSAKEKTREEFDREVAGILKEHEIDLVLMIGYMRIITPWFVNEYRNRIMNIHPSLLPAFAGGIDKNVHESVLERGCRLTGCTLHFLDEGVDTGPIIIQKTCTVNGQETIDSLKIKVQNLEQDALVEGIRLFAEGRITVENNNVIIKEEQ